MEFGRLLGFICAFSLSFGFFAAEQVIDTREGENVSLECRYAPQLSRPEPSYYWVRKKTLTQVDNVVIQGNPLNENYHLDFRPDQGKYDLLITNASYARDDGIFACTLQESRSGRILHAQNFTLTVLTPPGPPILSPGPNPTATEGKPLELNCSSHGGSPSPKIMWFKDGSSYPVEAEMHSSLGHDSITTSVLSITPSMKDDGAVYRCVIENRAMADGDKLEAKLTLNVNYFPRVEVGPENPLRVERDGTATLHCSVDAKPKVTNVRWTRGGRFISTSFTHTLHRVTTQEAGKYTCTADNGLGQAGEAHVVLDVLFPPTVTIETGSGGQAHREAEEGETLVIKCNVTSNPEPIIVEWVREGRPEFRQIGEVLRINNVSADHAGTYTCRAVNTMTPSAPPRRKIERVGNATITLLVRHRPGKTSIGPDKPVAVEGTGVTLTCAANPPGWPTPQYRWWKDTGDSSSSVTVLVTGQKYNIPSAHLGSEGKYHCQATNEMGPGTEATVTLEVHQPPRFVTKLQPHVTRRVGDSVFFATCSAQGKPVPAVKWLKDGYPIIAGDQPDLEISTDEKKVGMNTLYTVQSELRFKGDGRTQGNQLRASDRGVYSCIFENEVKKTESTMQLRIEHEPVILLRFKKVAYDLHETAQVVCRVQAYPRPEFQWSYGTNAAPLQMSSDGHYEYSTTNDDNDVYTSVLKIANIRDADYGDYTCRVGNSLGTINTVLRLQRKGSPEHPITISSTNVGPNFVTLRWEPGFDGGLLQTMFFVSYRRVPGNVEDAIMGDCGGYESAKRNNGEWQEFDCQQNNPCNVTSLDQHYSYTFKVRAFNTNGKSNYSDVVTATTKVDRIPAPQRVTYDPETHQLSINTAATCLQLIGFVEATTDSGDEEPQWRLIETLPMMGGSATRKEATILSLVGRNKEGGRSLGAEEDFSDRAVATHNNPRVRVKFCLRQEQEHCSESVEAEIGPSYVNKASFLETPTLIAIIVSCIVFVLFAGLMYMFCRCKRGRTKKAKGKDYEVEQSVRPSLVTQPPPPYYPAPGLENQAMERSMDLETSGKPPLYGYHGNPPQSQQHNPNGGEWVNMGYMDNSYSNSNNGGSVNSQDSLWQMKMAAAAGGGVPSESHHLSDRYGYDPVTHGGYGTVVDDYAPYPHLDHNNAPSRQEYNMAGDPYAAVHKPKKRFDQHLDSPYHDVSGLPDPYMDQMDCDESKPQHISLSFDESLESGYSTPNSRNRRVIREIIV